MAAFSLPPDRSVLAGRIQGFGNVNPPPLEEETGSTVAKKALGRLGDLVGEEVKLTVEDFKEKGAVGAVKDAVADAGDILIDGVSGLVGWIRGDLPPEEDSEKTEAATNALSNGPPGAAYGVSQASPTGGINAVWVMPEDADPNALASLNSQVGVRTPRDPRIPMNIEPYQPAPSSTGFRPTTSFSQSQPLSMPGVPTIAPYEPAPSGPPAIRTPPYIPGGGNSSGYTPSSAARWGPTGYSPSTGSSLGTSSIGGSSGSRALVGRVATGEVLVDVATAKRLVSQCNALNSTAKQLAEMICERVRRLYLGLDCGDPAEADAALLRLLGLTEAIGQLQSDFGQEVVKAVSEGAGEELLSLRSNIKHKDAAEPLLRNLGLLGKAQALPDLLGTSSSSNSKIAPTAPSTTSLIEADLLGEASESAPKEADLLGEASESTPKEADLLGGSDHPVVEITQPTSLPPLVEVDSAVTSLDPLLADSVVVPSIDPKPAGDSLLAGLTIAPTDELLTAVAPMSSIDLNEREQSTSSRSLANTSVAAQGTAVVAAHAELDALMATTANKKDKKDAFNFVGDELIKAQSGA